MACSHGADTELMELPRFPRTLWLADYFSDRVCAFIEAAEAILLSR
jgi:hypothetical protein